MVEEGASEGTETIPANQSMTGNAEEASGGAISNPCTIDFDPPEAKRVQPALGPRGGGRRVTLRGTGFGPPPTSLSTSLRSVKGQAPVSASPPGMIASIGPTECLETEWVSQTSAVCVTPPGEGLYVDVSIKVSCSSHEPPPPVRVCVCVCIN